MERPAKGRLDLLRTARRRAAEEEPADPRGARPDDPSWRADALARSRHSRLDELRPPAGAVDEAAARALCADLTRQALGDLSPALVLLPAGERRRVQALAAYAFTLFDFARQRGVEGERLAQVNRWEFTLEAALAGEAAAQPVFVAMAEEHRRRGWPEAALGRLAAAARERVSEHLPATAEELEGRRRRLAAALAEALLPSPPAPSIAGLGAALLAVPALVGVGEELRQKRSPVAAADLPPAWVAGRAPTPAEVLAAVERSGGELRLRLQSPPAELAALPLLWRRALTFLRLAALTLLGRLAAQGEALLVRPPRLGLGDRLLLLLRARWSGR